MANRANLDSCTFTRKSGDVSYGYILSDDYGTEVVDYLDSNVLELSDLDLLKLVHENQTEVSCHIFENMSDLKRGLHINGNYYDHDDIEPVFE